MRLNTLPPLFSEADITRKSYISRISDDSAVRASILLSQIDARNIQVPSQYIEILSEIRKRNESYTKIRFISVSNILSVISRFIETEGAR
ncbi:MAG: hypothetical protein OEX12_01160 [Gammaproteobacteria bacterium]|nr:hypothetical protein [Gammaproteobacteria bacterium]